MCVHISNYLFYLCCDIQPLDTMNAYQNFQERFKLLATKHPKLIANTLSNIFTMRLLGNKTHGDLAEVGIAEFIHQFMYDFDSKHVGKDLYRAKNHEEDIIIIDEISKEEIPVSLKAYGDGPLQLSTDKDFQLFPKLSSYKTDVISGNDLKDFFNSEEFTNLNSINIMPLIYREEDKKCKIMVFDIASLATKTHRIIYIPKDHKFNEESQRVEFAKGRKHPIFMFLDTDGKYICEVRYGDAAANALQRGLWTHTQHAEQHFNSLTNNWIPYEHNLALVKLFRLALNSTIAGHEIANKNLQADIDEIRNKW